MAQQVQFRRGSTSQHGSFTGAVGEVTVDTDKDTLLVHDGSTAGGKEIASLAGAQTLTNKTLTAPKIASGGFIADANGNELIIFTTTSSAVNEITFANAATSGVPTITTTGGDTNIGLKISPKGSGTIDVDTSQIINVTDPTANQHAATKAYVDSQVSSLSSDKINEGNSKVEVTDSGTGNVVINVDGTDRITSLAATTTTATGHSFVMGAASTSAAGSIKFLEGTDNGTNGVTLQGPASTADVTVTLPSSAGTLALANADTTGTAAIATTVTVADESSDTSCFPLFATAASGDLGPKSGSNLTFNSSSGLLTATSFAGALTGDVTGTADVATAVTVADESSDTSCNVLFVTAATGDLPPKSGTNLTFNSSSGVLTATGFAGALTGNVTGTADVATVATTVTITDNESTDESNALIFTAGGDTDGGNLGLESDGTLTYNPSTGVVTATGFAGALTGNVTGNASGSSGSCTGNAATATILETARNIGGVSFNGSAAINLPGVNTGGNQDTSGTAAIATAVTCADESSDTSCNVLFVTAATGNLPPKTGTNLTFDSANGNLTTTLFTGTATAARYADLAEMYASDETIPEGTVVCFAGDGKLKPCNSAACRKVAGIVSTDPAYLMNSTQEGVALALAGRVPCKVIGPVEAGDMMISAGNGMAKAFDADVGSPKMGTVLGKAIEDHVGDETTTGVIEVLAMMM